MLAFRPTWFFCVLLLTLCAAGSLLDDILTAFEKAVDCGSCHALLVLLQSLALLGDNAFVGGIVTLCKTLKVSTTVIHCSQINQ